MHELEARTMLSTFTVTNTGDNIFNPGYGSFRWALGQVNADANPGVDTIDFAIPGPGPFTIQNFGPLPPILHPVLIDGYSQAGASPNTQQGVDDAMLMIQLDGTYSGFGLDVVAPGCTIQGLAITNYAVGVQLDNGSSGALIQGNFIGTDITGYIAEGNGSGVLIDGGANDTIGGTTPAARNIISANTDEDVWLEGSTTGNLIGGNFIGWSPTGFSVFSNASDGVNITGSGGNTIGGTAAGAGNVVVGQLADGIQLDGTNSNLVQGNFIGTDPTGTINLGSPGPGILIQNNSLDNTIGGTAAGAGNTIAFNSAAGIVVGTVSNDLSTGNEILSNSIDENSFLGIDLGDDFISPNSPGGPHVGPNDLQNFPVLTTAATLNGRTYVVGTFNSAPGAAFTLQFFANANPDPTGYGQGQALIGTTTVTTDSGGNATFALSFPTVVPIGQAVSATATDASGNTSEFGPNATVFAATGTVVAVADAYNIDTGTTLTVSAPGVLGNDYDLTGKPLTAALVTGPGHGTLSIHPDGSFVYTPKAAFTGTDTFTYDVNDGTTASSPATVTISVNPKTYTVTNTNDSGPGSLRQAILDADLATSAPPDTILFKIPGPGPFVIAPLGPLPELTHATIVDGYSQPGARRNNSAVGDNAVLEIQLSGVNLPFSDGLIAFSGGSTIEGLSITGFYNGLDLYPYSSGSLVRGDWIGVAPSGAAVLNRNDGVFIDSVPGATIGGATAAARDVIANNAAAGIFAETAVGTVVWGDEIGTDPSGTRAMGNGVGIDLDQVPWVTTVAGDTVAGNLISANLGDGVRLTGVAGTSVQGNLIGTDATALKALGNGGHGVYVQASKDTIGGTARGAGNLIADNRLAGVAVVDNGDGSANTGVSILSNSTFGNQGLGIDLGDDGVSPNIAPPLAGPNNHQPFPVLTSAVSAHGKTTIQGSIFAVFDTTYLIQLFANIAADPSGYGQGLALIGSISVTTVNSRSATFTATLSLALPPGLFLSATATDPGGDTSEFAQDIAVTGGGAAAAQAVQAGSSGPIAPVAGPSAATKAVVASRASPAGGDAVDELARELVLLRQRRSTGLTTEVKKVFMTL